MSVNLANAVVTDDQDVLQGKDMLLGKNALDELSRDQLIQMMGGRVPEFKDDPKGCTPDDVTNPHCSLPKYKGIPEKEIQLRGLHEYFEQNSTNELARRHFGTSNWQNWCSPLLEVVSSGLHEAIPIMVREGGFNIDSLGGTAQPATLLYLAILHGDEGLVELLFGLGASVNERSIQGDYSNAAGPGPASFAGGRSGETPLQLARRLAKKTSKNGGGSSEASKSQNRILNTIKRHR
eukprot:Nk52_evm8s554 gene=Nk52_evmTU8s554